MKFWRFFAVTIFSVMFLAVFLMGQLMVLMAVMLTWDYTHATSPWPFRCLVTLIVMSMDIGFLNLLSLAFGSMMDAMAIEP